MFQENLFNSNEIILCKTWQKQKKKNIERVPIHIKCRVVTIKRFLSM